jgi:hypothetical protein
MQELPIIKTNIMKRKRTWLILIAVALAGGAWYGYKEYTRKVKDLVHVRAAFQLDATGLIRAFEQNEAAANTRYLDKIIAVNGKVKNIEKDEKGDYSIILGGEGSLSSVRCSMDATHRQDVTGLAAGTVITIKGACTGFNADELLGSDVILNRCVIKQ